MAKIRRLRPNEDQHKRWKAGFIKHVSKASKPFIESGFISHIKPTYPQPSWLFCHKLLFRSMHDLANPKTEWTPDHLSKKIGSDSPPNTIFFADTGFFSAPLEFSIWDALLTRKLAITSSVWEELQPWLANPHNNKEVRDLVYHAHIKKLPSIELILPSEYEDFSFSYYLALLSLRKVAWKKICEEYILRNGAVPSDDEMKNLLQINCGDGAVIAIKGWEDRSKSNLFADEELVILAVLTAILRGVEVVILTLDNDIQKQFIELTNLINGHYNSMWAGEYFWRNRDKYPGFYPPSIAVPEKETGVLFAGGYVSALFFAAESEIEFLPPNPIPAIVHCVFFDQSKTHRKYSVASFYGETGMRKLLETKGKTKGMNTDKFDGHNCYLTAAPPKGKPMLSFGLNIDAHVKINGVEITAIDAKHATLKRINSLQIFYQI